MGAGMSAGIYGDMEVRARGRGRVRGSTAIWRP